MQLSSGGGGRGEKNMNEVLKLKVIADCGE